MLKHKYVRIAFLILLAALILGDWRSGIFHWYAYLILGLVFACIIVAGSYFIRLNYFTPSLNHGPRQVNQIALTFDDGPMNNYTPRILDMLREYEVPGLFFLIGSNIPGNEAMLLRMEAEGHIAGNHSYSHAKWFSLKKGIEMLEDLKKCYAEIEKVLGKRPVLFRPPYGVTNPNMAYAIKMGGYASVGWSLRTYDTSAKNKDKLLAAALKKLRNGDIILLHDWGPFTAAILPELIEGAQSKGFKFVRADKLLGVQPYR